MKEPKYAEGPEAFQTGRRPPCGVGEPGECRDPEQPPSQIAL
jgi:hypothetical protein